jgi:trimethylamine corrinoid protein
MGNIFEEMEQAIIDGDEELCVSLAQKTIDEGIDPSEAIDKGFAKGMRVLGDRFENGECFLPALLTAEDAMNAAIEILKPKIEASKAQKEKLGKVVIGTIHGDVHDIGKNIVKLFMSVAGFDVIDLGRDVPVRNFIQTAQKENADIIAASALMATTMVYMPELIKQLKELGIREQYKVMIGGAPVIKSWAQEVGSDGYGLTAKEAVENAKELLI